MPTKYTISEVREALECIRDDMEVLKDYSQEYGRVLDELPGVLDNMIYNGLGPSVAFMQEFMDIIPDECFAQNEYFSVLPPGERPPYSWTERDLEVLRG